MHFVKTEELKTGMRLARPIYNKKSILLFDRNSLLSVQAIESIRNFGLIGVYVLEPAEPVTDIMKALIPIPGIIGYLITMKSIFCQYLPGLLIHCPLRIFLRQL